MTNSGANAKVEKMYIITKDYIGHLHRYISSKAKMHFDIVLEYNIDLDKHTILEKGFIFGDHVIMANFDIREKTKRCRKIGQSKK